MTGPAVARPDAVWLITGSEAEKPAFAKRVYLKACRQMGIESGQRKTPAPEPGFALTTEICD
jgi:hypothetical protein